MRHGGGGYTYSDCYNMPTQVRKYHVRRLSEEIAEENAKIEAARNNSKNDLSMAQMASGDVKGFNKGRQPDYIAKAPRK